MFREIGLNFVNNYKANISVCVGGGGLIDKSRRKRTFTLIENQISMM